MKPDSGYIRGMPDALRQSREIYRERPNKWGAYLWFTGWSQISLGLTVDVIRPNMEIHLPFCFIRIGNIK